MADNPLEPLPLAEGRATGPLDDDLGLDLQAEVAPPRSRYPVVPMWRRYLALAVDAALAFVTISTVVPWLEAAAGDAIGRGALLAGVAVALVLQAGVYSVRPGQTLGRVVARVRVVGADGSPASLTRGFLAREPLRVFFTQIGVVFLPFLRDREGRFPHEMATGTWVVPARFAPDRQPSATALSPG